MGRPKLVRKYKRKVDSRQGKIGGSPHYQATYVRHRNVRPSEIYKPPVKERPVFSPMVAKATSKDAYKSPGVPLKRQLIIPKEEMEMLNQPGKIDSTTIYKQDFPKKPVLPPLQAIKPEECMEKISGDFDSRTMNKQHYKKWKTQPRHQYKELNSFSEKLIYPGKNKLSAQIISTTHDTHNRLPTADKQKIKIHPDNIKLGQGKIDLSTTTKLAYQLENVDIPPRKLYKGRDQQLKPVTPHKMDLVSKYKSDFRPSTFLPPPKPSAPAPSTIQLKMFKKNKDMFETEQRKQFHGWDPSKYPRVEGVKLKDNTEIATGCMQTVTSNMEDFPTRKVELLKLAKRPSTKQLVKITKEGDKIDYTTSHDAAFKQWKNYIRKRYGDFHEASKNHHNLNSSGSKFDHVTTSQLEFVRRKATPRVSMKPQHKMAVDRSMKHDFNTTSRMCFTHPPSSAYEIEEIEVLC